jgi:hypothetical protein
MLPALPFSLVGFKANNFRALTRCMVVSYVVSHERECSRFSVYRVYCVNTGNIYGVDMHVWCTI